MIVNTSSAIAAVDAAKVSRRRSRSFLLGTVVCNEEIANLVSDVGAETIDSVGTRSPTTSFPALQRGQPRVRRAPRPHDRPRSGSIRDVLADPDGSAVLSSS
jgi:hypothetical protein